jgi:hypothetical protein
MNSEEDALDSRLLHTLVFFRMQRSFDLLEELRKKGEPSEFIDSASKEIGVGRATRQFKRDFVKWYNEIRGSDWPELPSWLKRP